MKRLIALADALLLELDSGRDVEPPLRAALLHDPDGEAWPKCSLLIGSFRRGRAAYDGDSKTDAWFGKDYAARRGEVTLPSKALSAWRRVGEVKEIFYDRRGTRAPGPFRHKFGKLHLMALINGRGKAVLYVLRRARGRWWRLEFPDGCSINWRGISWP